MLPIRGAPPTGFGGVPSSSKSFYPLTGTISRSIIIDGDRKMSAKVIFTILAATVLTLVGTPMGTAETGGNGTGGGDQNSLEQRGGNGNDSGSCIFGPADPGLSEAEITALLFIREEEKVARDSYLTLGDLWGLVIFENISGSEQDHMDAVKARIDCYGLVDPVIGQIGAFSNPDLQTLYDKLMGEGQKSVMDGLFVGALIEETDIADIESDLAITAHEDIVGTYNSIRCGSRNHLRSYIRQIENNGGIYTPIALDPEEFREIAYSPMEHDCGDF